MIVILPVGRPGPTQLYQANPATEVVALKAPAKLDVFEKVKAILHPDGTGEALWLKIRSCTNTFLETSEA